VVDEKADGGRGDSHQQKHRAVGITPTNLDELVVGLAVIPSFIVVNAIDFDEKVVLLRNGGLRTEIRDQHVRVDRWVW
jgi:hypothetical protein